MSFHYPYSTCNLTAFLLIITYLSVLVQCLQFKLCDQFPHSFLYCQAIVDHQRNFIIHRGNGDCELVGHLKQIKITCKACLSREPLTSKSQELSYR